MSQSEIALGERQRAGVIILVSPGLLPFIGVFSQWTKGLFPAPLDQGLGPDCHLRKQKFRVPDLLGVSGWGI